MQDKITIANAPDCLNTNDKAMWTLGYQAAIEARSSCLLQIQEPPTKTEALAHYSQQAILAMDEAAPAAVAVPTKLPTGDEIRAIARSVSTSSSDSPSPSEYVMAGYSAALAATPAAAAPVVLPEPATWTLQSELDAKRTTTNGHLWFSNPVNALWTALYTEQQMRALLAGVSAPATGCECANCANGMGECHSTPQAQADARDAEQYRLLQRGQDTIQADDEYLREDGVTWRKDPSGIFVGIIYEGNILLPARRAIAAQAAAQGGE